MTIRTISQLPESTSISDGTYFEISTPKKVSFNNNVTTGYVSQKVNFNTINTQVSNNVLDTVKSAYGLIGNDNENINVKDLENKINNIIFNDISLDGTKTFKDIPKIDNQQYQSENLEPTHVATVDYVNNAVTTKIPYNIGSSSNFKAAKTDNGILNEEALLKWRIDAGEKESNEIVCNTTGNLVIYGWLADNGNTISQHAWVGLFGEISGNWILLQLQPWIIGQKSSIMQYVGFNIPVKNGLHLKIKTGFAVNGSNSVQMDTFGWGLQTVNNFAGYIIY